jgi:hypothetical protein
VGADPGVRRIFEGVERKGVSICCRWARDDWGVKVLRFFFEEEMAGLGASLFLAAGLFRGVDIALLLLDKNAFCAQIGNTGILPLASRHFFFKFQDVGVNEC